MAIDMAGSTERSESRPHHDEWVATVVGWQLPCDWPTNSGFKMKSRDPDEMRELLIS